MGKFGVMSVVLAAGFLAAGKAQATDETALRNALAQAQPTAATAELKQDVVYRFDPFKNEMVATPPAEILVGCVYNKFDPQLGRRAWCLAAPGGTWSYAVGDGTVLKARRLDIRASIGEVRSVLEARAPRLADALKREGGVAHVSLVDGRWTLVQHPTIERIFDERTGLRWEWHGMRRVAVVHTYGDRWAVYDGKYVPAG